MTELLIGTKKGLFVLEGEPGAEFGVVARAFAGEPVEYAVRDPRSRRLLASVTSPFYGPKIWWTDDPAGEWTQADGDLYAGGDPGVLFESHDGGASWSLNRGLWDHPTRPEWQPGGGGLCLHSIVPWPGDPDRLALAMSAVGVWLTDDGMRTWEHGNDGLARERARGHLEAGGGVALQHEEALLGPDQQLGHRRRS